MTYALVIVDKALNSRSWPDAMHKPLYDMPKVEGVTRLNEGAWLLQLDSSLLFLAGLIRLAHENNLPHHVAFFAEKPSFVCAPQTSP